MRTFVDQTMSMRCRPCLVVLAVAACLGVAGAQRVSADGNPSASGHGNITVGDKLRTFSFTAVLHQDGTVTGEAITFNRLFDSWTHTQVDCLVIVGNTARISGVVVGSNDPDRIGEAAVFAVRDNGEGADDLPDRITPVGFPFPVAVPDLCKLLGPPPDFFFMPIEGGNVQVNP